MVTRKLAEQAIQLDNEHRFCTFYRVLMRQVFVFTGYSKAACTVSAYLDISLAEVINNSTGNVDAIYQTAYESVEDKSCKQPVHLSFESKVRVHNCQLEGMNGSLIDIVKLLYTSPTGKSWNTTTHVIDQRTSFSRIKQ